MRNLNTLLSTAALSLAFASAAPPCSAQTLPAPFGDPSDSFMAMEDGVIVTQGFATFDRISTGNIWLPDLSGNWYATEKSYTLNNSNIITTSAADSYYSLVKADNSYSIVWQPSLGGRWLLVYSNVENLVGNGAGIDYNWSETLNAATESNNGNWLNDFSNISFSKSGTAYNGFVTPAVPEPAGAFLPCLAAAALALSRRRDRKGNSPS
jgi:hypothetical protein